MTIDKAIEIIEHHRLFNDEIRQDDYRDALTLAIKALKRIQSERATHSKSVYSPLPGETKE